MAAGARARRRRRRARARRWRRARRSSRRSRRRGGRARARVSARGLSATSGSGRDSSASAAARYAPGCRPGLADELDRRRRARPRVAQQQARLDAAVVLVDLERERRVERVLAVDRRLAERDGAGAGGARGDGEAHVLVALPHRARVAAAGGGHEQRHAGVADPERREALQLLGERQADLVAGDDGVDAPRRDEVLGRQRRRGVRLEGVAEGVDLRGEDLAAGGRAVAAVAAEVRGRRVQPGEQVEAGDRAARSRCPTRSCGSSATSTVGR